MTCDEVRPLLNARLDQETDRMESAALDSHLVSCSDCAVEFERLLNVQVALRAGLRYHKAPEGLRDRVRFALRGAVHMDRPTRQPHWRIWGSVAAAFFICGLAAAPFLVNERNQRRMVAEELFSAHERALMGREIDVLSSDNHTVKPWFNGKLPFSPPVNDLAPQGFPLAGGRLDYVGGNPVAVLVYRRRLHRIDVFVRPSSGKKAPARFERDGFIEISWTKGSFLFAAVSDLNAAEMTTFAELLRSK